MRICARNASQCDSIDAFGFLICILISVIFSSSCIFSLIVTLSPIVWSADTRAHTRDPKETRFDPSDPKAKQTYVPKSETFEEYMKRRAAGGKSSGSAAPAPASSAWSSAPKPSAGGSAPKPTGSSTYHLHLSLVSTGASSRTSALSAAAAPRTRQSGYSLHHFP